MLGHLSYNYPKLQVQGEFANIARSNQPSYDEPGESDVEELSERGYKKDEYEVEV